MASYFDEHDCQENETYSRAQPDLMEILRMFLREDEDALLDLLPQGERLAPPAAKHIVQELPRRPPSEEELKNQTKCPVCLVSFDAVVIEMPCGHSFHSDCLLPWLQKTNSCPLCRHELLTDSPDYERYKEEKAKEKEKQFRVEQLHNSMFG